MTTNHAPRSDDSSLVLMLDALGNRIAETAMLIDAATHQLLADLRLFDEAEGWRGDGALSAAHWLAWRTGMDLGASREKVRVARALGSLPLIDDALRTGALSFSKARALTRVANGENEATLLELALTSTASQLEAMCRLFRQTQLAGASAARGVAGDTAMSAMDDARAENRRWLRVRPCDDDGLVRLEVKLTALEAALVIKACKSAARAHEEDDVAGLCAIAEASLRGVDATEDCELAGADDAASDDAGSDDKTPHAVTTAAPSSAAAKSRPPVEILLHIDASTLVGETEQGFPISAETSRRLLCDAGVVPVLEAADGRVVDAGKKLRTAPAALRRALRARDRGCRFPSCTNQITDVHHLHHWIDGGETTLHNTALLCPAHHRLLHEGGFTVSRRDDSALGFFTPDGTELPDTGWRTHVGGRGAELLSRLLASRGVLLQPETWQALR